jgi:hypothetical protein
MVAITSKKMSNCRHPKPHPKPLIAMSPFQISLNAMTNKDEDGCDHEQED